MPCLQVSWDLRSIVVERTRAEAGAAAARAAYAAERAKLHSQAAGKSHFELGSSGLARYTGLSWFRLTCPNHSSVKSLSDGFCDLCRNFSATLEGDEAFHQDAGQDQAP